LLGGFALLALMSARNIPLFVIAAAPILAEKLAERLQSMARWKKIEGNILKLEGPLKGGVWPVLVCACIGLMLASRFEVRHEAISQFDASVFPVAAADWLESHPQSGNMFNEFNWGGYLLYRLWPEQKVYIDSQSDFYGEAFLREYEHNVVVADGFFGPYWEDAFARHNVTWAILPTRAPLVLVLHDAGWHSVYYDTTAVILRKP
jgi:hypothetical protein